MPNSALTEYISTSLAAGYNLQQLRGHLIAKGWKPVLVDETMAPFSALQFAHRHAVHRWVERLLCLSIALLAGLMAFVLHNRTWQ